MAFDNNPPANQARTNYSSSNPGGQDQTKQLINEIRIMISRNMSEMQIISALTKQGLPPAYSSRMINYVREIDGMNRQAYATSGQQSGRLRQVPQQQNQTYAQYQKVYTSSGQVQNYNQNLQANGQQFASQQSMPNHGKRNPIVLLMVLFVIIGLAFGLTYVIRSSDNQTSDKYSATFKISNLRDEYSAGNTFDFMSDFKITSVKKQAKIQITYFIYDSNQDTAHTWDEQKSIDNKLIETVHTDLPSSLIAGQYYLFAEATFPDGTKVNSRTGYFTVNSENQVNANQENNGEIQNENNQENNNQNNEYPANIANNNENENVNNENNINNENMNSIDNGKNGINDDPELEMMQQKGVEEAEADKEVSAKFELALSYINSDTPDNARAASVCIEFTDTALRDSCMTQLAHTSKNYAFCNEIRDSFNKDYCYLNYVINTKDYEKCSFIESPDSKHSCEELETTANN